MKPRQGKSKQPTGRVSKSKGMLNPDAAPAKVTSRKSKQTSSFFFWDNSTACADKQGAPRTRADVNRLKMYKSGGKAIRNKVGDVIKVSRPAF